MSRLATAISSVLSLKNMNFCLYLCKSMFTESLFQIFSIYYLIWNIATFYNPICYHWVISLITQSIPVHRSLLHCMSFLWVSCHLSEPNTSHAEIWQAVYFSLNRGRCGSVIFGSVLCQWKVHLTEALWLPDSDKCCCPATQPAGCWSGLNLLFLCYLMGFS